MRLPQDKEDFVVEEKTKPINKRKPEELEAGGAAASAVAMNVDAADCPVDGPKRAVASGTAHSGSASS